MSGDRPFDEIARILASPMPRRRALKLAGGALIGAAFANLGIRRAAAQESGCCEISNSVCLQLVNPRECRGTFFPGRTCCEVGPGGTKICCAADKVCRDCIGANRVRVGRKCCSPQEKCSVCPGGTVLLCCTLGTECVRREGRFVCA